jgi:hypothetical protein
MCFSALLRIKGTLAWKYITLSIAPIECNNYVSIEFANELMILESNIIEKIGLVEQKTI